MSLPTAQALYDSLTGEQKFRLVRLSSKTADVPSFELRTVLLDDDVAYTALSYVWGPPKPTFNVELDGHAMTVQRNLYMFLVEVAKSQTRDWFFVDAICINQDDLDERAAQVGLMGAVYKHAQEVRIWTPRFSEWWEPRKWKVWKSRYTKHDHNEDYLDRKLREYEELSVPEEIRVARKWWIDKFRTYVVYDVYWSRLWIVQEILLAKKLTFQMRSLSFEWEEVMEEFLALVGSDHDAETSRFLATPGVQTLNKKMQDTDDQRPDHNSILFRVIIAWVHSARNDLRNGNLLPLKTALRVFGTQGCSVPHDKIFGFSSIAHTRIHISYKISVMELLANILGDCLLSMGFDRSPSSAKLDRTTCLEMAFLSETIGVALKIDWFDPVVFLIARCVARFFVPDDEESMCFWITYGHADRNRRSSAPMKQMLQGKTLNEARREEVLEVLGRAERAGTLVTAPEKDGEARDFAGWTEVAERVCEDLMERYRREEAEGRPKLMEVPRFRPL
ncbi:hypothetical protein DOTSEDRAFT_159259 [Dothistroma septosporum NZE10]|uniref:Heterokaryon incompatibility domain-containing protein n=1 Tax=Dothistroma septosporum (strain NZE10 / CBS 128990) TaxID=675120 RepID=M2XI10_DOTSN|nr:hypothetical protein DOTSEDRAFT_159259 [Dothistroma septosporum NZE10]